MQTLSPGGTRGPRWSVLVCEGPGVRGQGPLGHQAKGPNPSAALSPQSRGPGGLLHLPGHLLGHHLVPLWVHLLFRLEEATMS